MFFEDIFNEFLNNDDIWFPIFASIEEEFEERDLNEMTEEEIRSYYE